MKNLTKRQLETLLLIQEIQLRDGRSPVLSELRRGLKVKSDQSVDQFLKKLEGFGYVFRKKGEKRNIEITPKAYEKVPELNFNENIKKTLTDSISVFPQKMNLRQNRIFEKLAEIDKSMVPIYKGVIYAISEKNNPDWQAQSAHSIREVFAKYSNQEIKISKKLVVKNNKKDGFAIKNEKIGDPRASELSLKEKLGKSVYDEWNRKHNEFVEICHHRAHLDGDEYIRKVADYEAFLLKYVFSPQIDKYEQIDKEIKKGPKKVDKNDLINLITCNLSTFQYFFSRISHNWLKFIYENGLLVPIAPVGDYLIRVAPDDPFEIIEIIKKYSQENIGKEFEFCWRYFIKIALLIPVIHSRQLVDIMVEDNWIEKNNLLRTYWSFEARELFEKLILKNEHQSAQKFLKELLRVKKTSDSKTYDRFETFLDKNGLHEIIKTIDKSPDIHLGEYVSILLNKLDEIARISIKNNNDPSNIWYSLVNNNKNVSNLFNLRDFLIFYTKKYISKYFDYLIKNKSKKIVKDNFKKIFKTKYKQSVNQLIEINFLRKHPVLFKKEIQKKIIGKFDQSKVDLEYDYLLSESFGAMDMKSKNEYFKLISKKSYRNKDDVRSIKYYSLIEDHLPSGLKKEYKRLIALNDGIRPKLPDSDSEFVSSRWLTPQSPKSKKELKNNKLEDNIKFFVNWKPKDNDGTDRNRMELAKIFVELVKEDVKYYSYNSDKLKRVDLRPVYFYKYYSALTELARKKNQNINWGKIIELSLFLIQSFQEDKLMKENFDEDGFIIDWDSVFQYMANLIEIGLNNNLIEVQYRAKIWEIIAFVCESKQPTLEYEKKYGNDNDDNSSLSINTTRGVAFHALFAYVFWCDRVLKLKNKGKSRIVSESKKVLEEHLELDKEPGNIIQSVYGRYFNWMYVYDKKWTEKITNKIFPIDNYKRRYAAWETYLIGPLSKDLYNLLRPQYEKALNELFRGLRLGRVFVDPRERLISHLMIAFFYEIAEKEDSLLQFFYQKLKGKYTKQAVTFAGRFYVLHDDKNIKKPKLARMKEFWEWRLKESKSADVELREFGWWIKKDFFNNKWMLEMLVKTLKKTNGLIEADHNIIEVLEELSDQYLELTSEALFLMIKSENQNGSIRILSKDKIKNIISKLFKSNDKKNKKMAEDIVEYLLKLGDNEFLIFKKEINENEKIFN